MSFQLDEYGINGHCPVQAEGIIGDRKFYFRSRGEWWTLYIDKENPLKDESEVEFYYQEQYGKWPDAGYITEEEALTFIEKGIELWRIQTPP